VFNTKPQWRHLAASKGKYRFSAHNQIRF